MIGRRKFLSGAALGLGLLVTTQTRKALADTEAVCNQDQDDKGITGRSQGFSEIRHQHQFIIPLAILINPPAQGYSARSSTPLKGQTDFEGLRQRTDSEGRPLDLRGHAHTVTLTQADLIKLSEGKHVTISLDQFSHKFYFVANDATLAAIKQAQGHE